MHTRTSYPDAAVVAEGVWKRYGRNEVTVTAGSAALVATVRELDRASVATDDIGLRRPTLDDVFLRLTGHAAEAGHEQSEVA
jgi:ABC-2 type transport system ATP-binding protein